VQLASHAGATVIATASGDDEAYLNSIGASRVIDYREVQFEKVLRVAPVRVALLALASMAPALAAEVDALAISRTIQERHFPHFTLLDPIFDGPASNQIVSYTRCGDSAIWTGHYLAAEAFRYAATDASG
jgi:hypothetical protein